MKKRTLLQYFEWYLPADAAHWQRAEKDANHLANAGFTTIWLPPAYKGANGINDVGYGAYDLYDLGEFNQKGTVPTKYGRRDELTAAIKALHENGLEVMADIVLNHKIGADECELVNAEECSASNRNCETSGQQQIMAWTKFTFAGRAGQYSDFQWNHNHFDGVDWDDRRKSHALFQFEGKTWDGEVDKENGNYDYLMGADLDMGCQSVIDELDRWGEWYLNSTQVDCFRLDAVKHIRFTFFTHWLKNLRDKKKQELFAVGEYWSQDLSVIKNYLDKSGNVMSVFDVPLHFNFYKASTSNSNFDMRDIFKNTLVSARPQRAVTFVDNHDTQPGQALQSAILPWFKPLAYAMILLREEGTPCVFYGDYYGIPHDNIEPVKNLDKLLLARQKFALGEQVDYIDDFNIIGFTRQGDEAVSNSGCAVIISDGVGGEKTMCVGANFAGKTFVDFLGNSNKIVAIGEDGCGTFLVNGGSVSVYIQQ